MQQQHYTVSFSSGSVDHYSGSWEGIIQRVAKGRQVIIIADSQVYKLYEKQLQDWHVISINAKQKDWNSISRTIKQLIDYKADRHTLLIGLGGGTITDIAGFAASIYMRGLAFGFIPTTLLGMVDAAIGGKNGVDFGQYKNMLGIIRQPDFLGYDTQLLQTLPKEEWSNGFAEIIKYACIFDEDLFRELEGHDLDFYMQPANADALKDLIQQCIAWKNKTVQEDEHEKGIRKLLNFGHTAGHAIEKVLAIPHGKAVAVGMMVACAVSEEICGLDPSIKTRLCDLLGKYRLPHSLPFNTEEVSRILKMDKKKSGQGVDYIILEELGKGTIRHISFDLIGSVLKKTTSGSAH